MFKKVKEKLLFGLAPLAAFGVIRLLSWSIRAEVVGEGELHSLWKKGDRVILAFWHDQLLLMAPGYRGPGSKILISPSKDGELIARTMAYFGQGAVRGSSSRGGRSAFRHLLALGKEPIDLVITPDGPKGPRHEVKEGVVQLARLTGRPVVPMAFAASRGHRFASWDRFLLPYPFACGVYAFGPPLEFQKGEDAGAFRHRLQQAMDENDLRARTRLESRGVSAV